MTKTSINTDEIKVESKEVRVWLGAEGTEYPSEFAALQSFIRLKLSKLLDVGGYESDPDGCADAVLKHRGDVLRWLRLLDSAEKQPDTNAQS